jgi:hypothetical protein
MLSLSLKAGEVVYFNDTPMTLLKISPQRILGLYQGTVHVIPQHTLYRLDPDTLILYRATKGNAASIQFDSTKTILREKLYVTRKL